MKFLLYLDRKPLIIPFELISPKNIHLSSPRISSPTVEALCSLPLLIALSVSSSSFSHQSSLPYAGRLFLKAF